MQASKKKLVRITTVPISIEKLLENQLRFMNAFFQVVAVSSDEDNLRRVGELQQVKTYHVELTRKITPMKDLSALWKLYLFFRKEKPFIVHTHTPKAGTIGMIAARLARVKNRLHTVAGLPLLEEVGVKRRLLNFVEKVTYSCATHVYPNSFGLRDIIVKEGFCEEDKLHVIASGSSNGIDCDYFSRTALPNRVFDELRGELGICSRDFIYIFVGRIVTDKGINELVNAFVRLKSDYKNVKLLMVGPRESELDPLLPSTDLMILETPAIISTGFQSDVRAYFGISNVLVFPSYREGFPNVVMQAGAMDLPSIVSDINGCNEIVEDGKNGLIVPAKDAETLYQAMKRLYEDGNLYQNLKFNARRVIKTRYDQQLVWEALLEEYKKLECQQ